MIENKIILKYSDAQYTNCIGCFFSIAFYKNICYNVSITIHCGKALMCYHSAMINFERNY